VRGTVVSFIVVAEGCEDNSRSHLTEEHVIDIACGAGHFGDVFEGVSIVGAARHAKSALSVWEASEGGENGAIGESGETWVGSSVRVRGECTFIIVH
jgi:hypothetical protein